MAATESFNSYHNLGNSDLPNTPNEVQSAWDELAALSRVPEVDQDLLEGVNDELEKIAPEGYRFRVDLDSLPNTSADLSDDLEAAPAEAVSVSANVVEQEGSLEQEDTREIKVKSLRERLKSRPSFVKKVGQAVQGMIERVQSRFQGKAEGDQVGLVEEDLVPNESEPLNEVTEEEDTQEEVLEQPAEYGRSEEDMEKQFQEGEGAEQERRRKDIRRLEDVREELQRRIWQSRDNLMQERWAQMADQVEKKILALKAVIAMVDHREQARPRLRTEMENHGQFALGYLQTNGIFDGPYDEEGLKNLRDLRDEIESKVVKSAVEQDELSGNEYVTQLEYIRPAIRELERVVHYPDEWKKIKFVQIGQKAG